MGLRGTLRGGDGARNFPRHAGWGGAGMGQEKSMRGGGEDPILRPRPAPLPSLIESTYWAAHSWVCLYTCYMQVKCFQSLIVACDNGLSLYWLGKLNFFE